MGQEVIKASTGKFTPIYQWFFFDALDVLQDERPPASDFELVCVFVLFYFCSFSSSFRKEQGMMGKSPSLVILSRNKLRS